MIFLTVLLAVALCAGLYFFGRLNSPKAEISKTLDLQMEVFREDMESLWRNVSVMGVHLSEDMTSLLENQLTAEGLAFDDLNGNLDATKSLENTMLEPLCQYIRQADCSGAFVILNTAISQENSTARSGLYVQKSNAEHLTGDLLLFRGIASVGKAHGVMPHRKWAQEFHTDKFPCYTKHLAQAIPPIADSCRTTNLVTLPGTSEKTILLTVPLIGKDGTVYGLCGFAVNQSYFLAHHAPPSNLPHLACLLTAKENETLTPAAGLLSYTSNGFCYVPEETLHIQALGEDLSTFTGDHFSFVGIAKPITTAKGDRTPHILAVLIPKEDYNQAIAKNVIQTLLLSALLIFFMAVCCFYLARRYLKPVQRDMERLQGTGRGGEHMAFSDFEQVSATLQAQDQAHAEIVTSLEDEKQTAQADAKRLAYSRKDELDPAMYAMFLLGYQELTRTERIILEALVDGNSVREIAEKRNCAESTVMTHRKSIYKKLGVHKAYQLQRCVALMRQHEAELQNQKK